MTMYDYRQSSVIEPLERGIDLQPLMRKVYMWMGLGTLLTAFVSSLTINTGLINVAMNPAVLFISIIAELGLVFGLSLGIRRLSAGAAVALFLAYAALNGFTLSLILLTFSVGTVEVAFFATAGLYGFMTIFAMTTKMDLSRMGTYLMMGVVGLVIAMVLNLFINSGPLDMLISMIGVLVFTGLTAYDTQQISKMAVEMNAEGEEANKFGIIGALRLYLDFINLFLFVLSLLGGGNRR